MSIRPVWSWFSVVNGLLHPVKLIVRVASIRSCRARDDAAFAPGEKLGIGFDVRDQRVHLLRAVTDQHRAIDGCIVVESKRNQSIRSGTRDDRREPQGPARLLHRGALRSGLALEGWEVKAIRAGRAQLKEAYVVVETKKFS